jgi:hypothetical protein
MVLQQLRGSVNRISGLRAIRFKSRRVRAMCSVKQRKRAGKTRSTPLTKDGINVNSIIRKFLTCVHRGNVSHFKAKYCCVSEMLLFSEQWNYIKCYISLP